MHSLLTLAFTLILNKKNFEAVIQVGVLNDRYLKYLFIHICAKVIIWQPANRIFFFVKSSAYCFRNVLTRGWRLEAAEKKYWEFGLKLCNRNFSF